MAKSLDEYIKNVPSQTNFYKVELYNFTDSGASKFIYVSTPLTAEELQCFICARNMQKYAQVKDNNTKDFLYKPEEIYGLDSFAKILIKLAEKRYYRIRYISISDGKPISYLTNDIEDIIYHLKNDKDTKVEQI